MPLSGQRRPPQPRAARTGSTSAKVCANPCPAGPLRRPFGRRRRRRHRRRAPPRASHAQGPRPERSSVPESLADGPPKVRLDPRAGAGRREAESAQFAEMLQLARACAKEGSKQTLVAFSGMLQS